MKDTGKERISPVLALLALGCLVMPIRGGSIATDSIALDTSPLAAVLSGDSLPTLQHAFLALPFLAALLILLLQRKVLQVPMRALGICLAAFFGILLATFIPASFKGTSAPVMLEWLCYAAAFYAVVAGAGRRLGPRVLLMAIFAGCTLTALRGIMEYLVERERDPTWRIFGGWINANAMAAIMAVGIFLGIGLAMSEARRPRLLCIVFTVPQVVALYLTKSRGGFAVDLVGLALFVLMVWAWNSKKASPKLVPAVAGLMIAAIAVTAILAPIAEVLAPVSSSAKVELTKAGAGAGRLSAGGIGTDESLYFRRLLWKGTGTLMHDYPTGLGMGNYRYYSGKSGLTTQTQLAHDGMLQLATEGTMFAPLALAAALLLWAYQVCRAPRGLPAGQNALRAALIAAVFSVLAHNLIDSDLYYFGLGVLTFVLLGVSLLLSTDAVAPEFTPAALRRTAAGAVALLTIGLFYCGAVETQKAQVRYAIQQRDGQAAQSGVQSLLSMAPYDADAWELASSAASSSEEALDRLQTAVKLGPNTRNLRALAYRQEQPLPGDAITSFNRALEIDPNNLVTLYQLMKFQEGINPVDAQQTAERMVAVEETLYYKIRSLPEIVPTETFSAREYLASVTTSSRRKVDLMLPALRGYQEYAHVTVGYLVSQGGNIGMGEVTTQSAEDKMNQAIIDAKDVQRTAMTLGDRAAAAEASKAEADFERALDKLRGSSNK